MIRRKAAAVVALAMLAAQLWPAGASARVVVATLGRDPVLGSLQSKGDLQRAVRNHPALFRQASVLAGLTDQQSQQAMAQIQAGHVRYITLPQHLDRMTWGSPNVHVLDDVVIPPGTKGWEVDLKSGRKITALLIPAACGNVSVIHRMAPRVVAMATPRPPLPPPYVRPTAAPVPPAPAPVETPVPAPPPETAVHRAAAVPWFLPLLGLIFFTHTPSSTNGPPPIIPTPPCTPDP